MQNTVTICGSSNQILAGLLSGDPNSKPNVMYVEFQAGSTPVTDLPQWHKSDEKFPYPSVDPTDTEYYLRLRENIGSNRDFLRIPVVSVTVQKGADPNDLQVYFNGICVGTKGVGGKSTVGATIYGIALAASPTYGVGVDDITRDILWARGYYAPENQIPFSNVAQTSVTFKLNLEN